MVSRGTASAVDCGVFGAGGDFCADEGTDGRGKVDDFHASTARKVAARKQVVSGVVVGKAAGYAGDFDELWGGFGGEE
jgi:hypothetical protein